jgi:hypothetical protein
VSERKLLYKKEKKKKGCWNGYSVQTGIYNQINMKLVGRCRLLRENQQPAALETHLRTRHEQMVTALKWLENNATEFVL